MKLLGHRPGLPGNVTSLYIVPLDPAHSAGLAGHVPAKRTICNDGLAKVTSCMIRPPFRLVRGTIESRDKLRFPLQDFLQHPCPIRSLPTSYSQLVGTESSVKFLTPDCPQALNLAWCTAGRHRGEPEDVLFLNDQIDL